MKRNVMLVIFLALVLSLWFSLSISAQEDTTTGGGTTGVTTGTTTGVTTATTTIPSALSADKTWKVKDATPIFNWMVIIAILGLAFAAVGGAWSQSKALRTAVDNIGRNPAAADAIRGILIIGLALIESLVIYVLLIDFIVLQKWGNFAW